MNQLKLDQINELLINAQSSLATVQGLLDQSIEKLGEITDDLT